MYRYFILAVIIFAGEIIFGLPFHVARFFRPTLLQEFQLTNTQLGDVFAAYGVVAMLCYFPGGLLADRFSTRRLLSVSLLMTSFGGIYFATIPSLTGLYLLFAYWGMTSILLFWAAMIKATREWGGAQTQGLAFGLLDGGRGLVASLLASMGVLIFIWTSNNSLVEFSDQRQSLQLVIVFYALMTFLGAICVWLFLPENKISSEVKHSVSLKKTASVLRSSTVWLQAGVVIAAYCGYKALDNYGIYATEVLGMDALQSAEFVTYVSYTRPVAAIGAGLLVDRYRGSRIVILTFLLAMGAFLSLAILSPDNQHVVVMLLNLVVSFVAVYALRGVYFALLEESQVDAKLTGTAVGLISAVGYTPDIFFAPITGRILDSHAGLKGFQNYFLLMAVISLLGLLFSILLAKKIKNN